MRHALLAAAAIALAACGQPADPTATASTDAPPAPEASGPMESAEAASPPPGASLAARLDCVRQSGGVLVIAHRGGPTRDYPENAIESFERSFKAGTHVMEIDIAETKDGKLVLMHDDDLDRTTTGTGLVADHTLADIQALKLRTGSKTTSFHPPTLEAALVWAMKANAILELDKKRSASYAPIIAAIRAAKAENNVLLITYTDEQAIDAQKQAPDLVINATITSAAQYDRLAAAGINPANLLAWTGNTDPQPELWKALSAKGVESIFGANGPRDTAADTLYWQDDDGSEFNKLVADGLPILVTGMSDKVSRQLGREVAKGRQCGI